MKYLIYIGLFALISCRKTDTPEEQLRDLFGVEALVINGENKVEVKLLSLNNKPLGTAAQNINVTVTGPGVQYGLNELSPGYFVLENPDPPIYASAPYELNISSEDKNIQASTETPPAFNWLLSPAVQYKLDPGNPDAIIDVIEWNIAADHEFILKLEYLEAVPDPIPFPENNYNFGDDYLFPVPQSGIPLYAGYFKNYGSYKISVYAVSQDYVEYFFPVEGTLLPLMKSNIDGAFGYFTGVSSINFTLEIIG